MVSSLGYFVLLLGVLITVHELGHFLVAKALNVKVLKFSIGFGPKIFGFTRGETEYVVAWIPLGGYVKMAGEQPYDELSPEEAKRGFMAQTPWKRALIVSAGPVFNLVFPILLYFFVFLGTHEGTAPVVGSVEPGSPAAAAKLRPGDRVLAVDGTPIQTFEDLQEELQPRYEKEITLLLQRDGQPFDARIVPARSDETNIIETVSRGMIGISTWRAPVLGVPAGSSAEASGLRTFDRVVQVNGQPVGSELALVKALDAADGTLEVMVARGRPLSLPGVSATAPSLHTVKLEKQEGTGYAALGAERADLYVASVRPGSAAAEAGISRGDRILELQGQSVLSGFVLELAMNRLEGKPVDVTYRSGGAAKRVTLEQKTFEIRDAYGQAVSIREAGFALFRSGFSEAPAPQKVSITMGPAQALGEALEIVPKVIRQTAMVIPRIFTDETVRKNVGGPLMLYEIASKSAEEGLNTFLHAMAVISVNLGLMNLLPIPILDGFHLLAALWEGVRRRPIPNRAREIANMVGLAMIIALMVRVFYNDLSRWFS